MIRKSGWRFPEKIMLKKLGPARWFVSVGPDVDWSGLTTGLSAIGWEPIGKPFPKVQEKGKKKGRVERMNRRRRALSAVARRAALVSLRTRNYRFQ